MKAFAMAASTYSEHFQWLSLFCGPKGKVKPEAVTYKESMFYSLWVRTADIPPLLIIFHFCFVTLGMKTHILMQPLQPCSRGPRLLTDSSRTPSAPLTAFHLHQPSTGAHRLHALASSPGPLHRTALCLWNTLLSLLW